MRLAFQIECLTLTIDGETYAGSGLRQSHQTEIKSKAAVSKQRQFLAKLYELGHVALLNAGSSEIWNKNRNPTSSALVDGSTDQVKIKHLADHSVGQVRHAGVQRQADCSCRAINVTQVHLDGP